MCSATTSSTPSPHRAVIEKYLHAIRLSGRFRRWNLRRVVLLSPRLDLWHGRSKQVSHHAFVAQRRWPRAAGDAACPISAVRLSQRVEGAWAGADHRRVRRRSVGDRDVQPGRLAAWLRHRLDHAADVSADGRDPGNFRARRPRHRPRHIGQCVPALFAMAAQRGRGAAVHRQHHQHRRRPRRDGGCHQAADRRPQHHLRAVVRCHVGRGADLARLQALRGGAEMVDAELVRLCRCAGLCQGIVGRGAGRHPRSAHELERRLFHHHRRHPRHHDLALFVLLAGFAGGRGSARRCNQAAADRKSTMARKRNSTVSVPTPSSAWRSPT